MGGNGQVGFELARALPVLGEVTSPCRDALDLADPRAVAALLDQCKPSLIVNAAAWTDVDGAETKLAEARRMNAELPAQLVEYAVASGARMVHFSTDYVYSGDGNKPWREESPTGPLNVYGGTKLEGDQAVQAASADALILRTSWVYGARGRNFLKTMLRLGRDRSELSVVDDQIGAPTPARLIAQITLLALDRQIPGGVYHLTSRGETSWCQFARRILQRARALDAGMLLRPEGIHPIPSDDFKTVARRPLNSRLDLGKIEAALCVSLPDWVEQLDLTLKECLEK